MHNSVWYISPMLILHPNLWIPPHIKLTLRARLQKLLLSSLIKKDFEKKRYTVTLYILHLKINLINRSNDYSSLSFLGDKNVFILFSEGELFLNQQFLFLFLNTVSTFNHFLKKTVDF